MADFVQTMKDWRRMCENISCPDCEIFDYCQGLPTADIDKIQRIVTAWAAEHPEPVYPTWEKYLADLMMLDMMCDKTDNPNSVENYMRKTPIPAEIAKKLGLQPKE